VDETRGTGIVRHEPRHDRFESAPGRRQEVAEAIDRHITTHFGPIAFVLPEMVSHLVAVSVMVVEPTAGHPHYTLITSGMSERPMTVPEDDESSPYAELMLQLPADWPMTEAGLRDERNGWPVQALRQMARFPHQYGTWLGVFHSVPNGIPAEPYAPGIPFAGALISPMITMPQDAQTIEVADGTSIALLALVPLHPGEVTLKLTKGTDALISELDRGGVSELLDPTRPPLA
jgi:hypothetical protein